MRYITAKRYQTIGIDGPLEIPEETVVESKGNTIVHEGKRVCFDTSSQAFEFFARDDDGNGIERHEITHAIIGALREMRSDYRDAVDEVLSSFEKDENGNYPNEAATAIEALENPEKEFFDAVKDNPVFASYIGPSGYWNKNFFNGEIEDLQRLKALLK